MSGTAPYRSPYTPSPGGATPPADATPGEQIGELRLFFWLALLSTAIIGGSGVIAWAFATHAL
ncbi:MAG: hypothetical protein QXG65_00845 [Thermoplasmata archaeon]